MDKSAKYFDPSIITRKFTRTATLLRFGALAIALIAILAMAL